MTITIRVDLTIRDDMVSEFHDMILEDQKSALESEDGVVLSFDIVNDENTPNDFTLYQTSTSKEGLLKHISTHTCKHNTRKIKIKIKRNHCLVPFF